MSDDFKIYRSNDNDLRRQITGYLTGLSIRIDQVASSAVWQPQGNDIINTNSGDVIITNMVGTGYRMVVANSEGRLSTQDIPSGGTGESHWTKSSDDIFNNNAGIVQVGGRTGHRQLSVQVDDTVEGVSFGLFNELVPEIVELRMGISGPDSTVPTRLNSAWIEAGGGVDLPAVLNLGAYGSGLSGSGTVNLQTARQNRLTITHSGNVGIGEENPGAPLHIGDGGILINRNGGNDPYIAFSSDSTGGAQIRVTEDGDIRFTNGSASWDGEYVRIRASDGALFVNKDTGMRFHPNGNITRVIEDSTIGMYGGSDYLNGGGIVVSGPDHPTYPGDVRIFNDGFTFNTIFSNNQRVGIRSLIPAAVLDVRGNVWIEQDGAILKIDTEPGQITFDATWRTGGHPNVIWNLGGSEKIRFSSAGNVSIGTTVSTGMLNVAGELRVLGSEVTSHINYSTTEHTYIRGGKTASNVYLNDLNTGAVIVGGSKLQVTPLAGTGDRNLKVTSDGTIAVGDAGGGAFWAASGNNIYNTNTDRVIVGGTTALGAGKLSVHGQIAAGAFNGYRVHDTRTQDWIPTDYGDNSVSFHFTNTFPALTGNWKGVIDVRAWSGTYGNWQLAGNAANNATDPHLYYRQGRSATWGNTMRVVMNDLTTKETWLAETAWINGSGQLNIGGKSTSYGQIYAYASSGNTTMTLRNADGSDFRMFAYGPDKGGRIYNYGAGPMYFWNTQNSPMIFGVNSTEDMRLNDKQLSIGTTLSGYPLRVAGSGTSGLSAYFSAPIFPVGTFNVNSTAAGTQPNGLYITDLGGTQGTTLNPTYCAAIMAQTSSSRSIGFAVDATRAYAFRSHSNAGTYTWKPIAMLSDLTAIESKWASSGNNIYNSNSGNVGIGLTTANGKLEVNGAVIAGLGDANGFRQVGASYGWFWRMDASNYYLMQTASGDRYGTWTTRRPITFSNTANNMWFENLLYVLGSTGRVGIGKSNPTQPLSFADNVTTAGTINKVSYFDGGAVTSRYGVGISSNQLNYISGYHHVFFGGGTERMRIEQGGNVGIGDSTPSYKLDVAGTIRATGDVIAYSDRRVKKNIKPIENALDKLMTLTGYEFDRIDADKHMAGVIAQEVEEVLPCAVYNCATGYKSVSPQQLQGLILQALKELAIEVDYLRGQVDATAH